MALQVRLCALLMLLRALVLTKLRVCLENFPARVALPARFHGDTQLRVLQVYLFLLKELLCDGEKLRHLPFGVVDVELGRSVQFEGWNVLELEMALRADYVFLCVGALVKILKLSGLHLGSTRLGTHSINHHLFYFV